MDFRMQEAGAASVLERQNRELAILTTIATALNESVDLEASLGSVLLRVTDLFELQSGWVWLIDEGTGTPWLAASRNLPPTLADHPDRMDGICCFLIAVREDALEGEASVVTSSRMEWLTDQEEDLVFHASIPLHARGRALGVMNVASSRWRELSADDLRMLHIIGEMLGVAIERSRLYQRSVEAGASEERNRLAREIHDTLAQGLAASVLQLETAEALLDAGGETERVRAAVRQALTVTRQNLVDARRSVLDLRPAPLQGATLTEALRELCVRSSSPSPEIHFHFSGATRPLPTRFEAGLYRVAQEAIANALRHADARRVDVQLRVEPERITLTVADDGVGFDVEECCGAAARADRSERFGLIGVCERARLLGGEFRLSSAPGAGTVLEVEAPLD
jgi:two-component system, NarL family, sensor kinase